MKLLPGSCTGAGFSGSTALGSGDTLVEPLGALQARTIRIKSAHALAIKDLFMNYLRFGKYYYTIGGTSMRRFKIR